MKVPYLLTAQQDVSRTVNSRVAGVLDVDMLAYVGHAFASIQPPKAVGAALLRGVVHCHFKSNRQLATGFALLKYVDTSRDTPVISYGLP